MPTSVGPSTFGEENLVFGYDLGDTVNSFKGEPVTNLQTVGEGNVYTSVTTVNTTAVLIDMVTPFGNKAWKITIPANGTNGFSNTRARGPIVQINRDGTFYYHGAWVWMSDDDYILWEQGNNYVYKYSTGTNGMSSWSLRSALNRKDRVGREWKAWGAWTAITGGGTGSQYHTFYKNGTLTRDLVFYIVAPMWGVGKARPVFFANGTRSATQGLIDLTGNSTIDLTNVSFDGNAQMEFDGTDDFIDLGSSTIWNLGQNGTIETVVRREGSVSANHRIWCTFNNSSHLDAYLDAATGGLYLHGGAVGTNTQIPLNQYLHIIVRYSGGTVTIWYNGTSQSLTGTATGYNITNPSYTTLYLGRYVNESGYRWDGRIAGFRIYNRALTDSEIRSNFNAIKSRFGI
jgi:hypothetical protein